MKIRLFLIATFLLIYPQGFSQNMDMGHSYNLIDAQVLQITTEFRDAYAITKRMENGDVETKLFVGSASEPEVVLWYQYSKHNLIIGANAEIQFPKARDSYLTSDWANAQVYNIWKDRYFMGDTPLKAENLRWVGNYIRPEGVQQSGNRALRQTLSVITEFEGYTAISQYVENGRYLWKPEITKRYPSSPSFQTIIQDHSSGETVGRIQWDRRNQTLLWDFSGNPMLGASPKTLPDGWTFEPNPAWANIQAKGFVDYYAHNHTFKNDPGCDGLHWLDNTIFRKCCDDHDQCYEAHGCSSLSWFFLQGWHCSRCNGAVVYCFYVLLEHVFN